MPNASRRPARGYIKRHEGQLQERLAQSKSTRDIYARFNILITAYLTANPQQDGERKIIMDEEVGNATNLLTLWEFEGILKCSPIFYGYYSNIERPQYRMPLAYFLTGLVVYIYSFVAILRKMAENSRMSKLSEKDDECIFSWKLFSGWDFMIGNAETAHNRIASVVLGFKEALLEEAEKKKDLRNWRIISLRALVNICVVLLLAISAYAVVYVVSRTDDDSKYRSWWRENETTTVVTVISITFPVFFELLGLLEHYHPRKQLRLQLARIMLLNLLNLYSLIFALFSKIEGMSVALNQLKPNATNVTLTPNNTWIPGPFTSNGSCNEEVVSCGPCSMHIILSAIDGTPVENIYTSSSTSKSEELKMYFDTYSTDMTKYLNSNTDLVPENLEKYTENGIESTTISPALKELQRIKKLLFKLNASQNDSGSRLNDDELFDIFTSDENETNTTNSTDETLSTDMPTSQYTEIASTDINYQDIFTDIEITNASTEIEYVTDNSTPLNDTFFAISTTTTDTFTNFSGETYSPEITQSTDDPENTSEDISESNSNDLTTYHVTKETVYPYINTPYKTYKVYDTTTAITDSVSTYSESSSDKSMTSIYNRKLCPELSFNCTTVCGGKNITQVFSLTNCSVINRVCYERKCATHNLTASTTNTTVADIVYEDEKRIKQYNLTVPTRKKLLKLCWETMFGQELIKLTMMDLVFVLLGTLFMDFFRALFVRYMNRCWCWDLEKKFPEYGDFKIAENILHLINNQGMVWMGMFFSPGLVVLNVVKLMIMMYLRSWAVMTCNVPHEVVFRVSKSNNFYLALLLTMLFLCVLPVGYTIVWVKPSWHCGPFSEYDRIYYIMTSNIYKLLPKSLNFALEYITSPAIVIPLLVLLILIIYYLTSLTNSLREANNDLKIQLRRERTEERRKMFQLADTRRRAGSSAMDNTPFARWKKALPSLPLSKSIDSDDRKVTNGDETVEPQKTIKKRGGIFAKIVNLALDKKSDVSAISEAPSPFSYNMDDETDTDFHETLPNEILKVKDIKISKNFEHKKKNSVEFKTDDLEKPKYKDANLKVSLEAVNETSDKKAVAKKQLKDRIATIVTKSKSPKEDEFQKVTNEDKKINEKQASESSTQFRQSDSIGSVIPVIMISTTESDEEALQPEEKKDTKTKERKHKEYVKLSRGNNESEKRIKQSSSDSKSLRRQSSVDSIKDQRSPKETKPEDAHKYQYSL
ncbi:Transmembrane channel-like protein [Operophtera brumata]|uniref:Transmembrane channel-like protein n=1 Tax=Operophtera brumata TaxID=104452 RepID=A0A0L7L5G0_OPEBR|nr:Transmembrane channel-like protein [Operophtera brumata]